MINLHNFRPLQQAGAIGAGGLFKLLMDKSSIMEKTQADVDFDRHSEFLSYYQREIENEVNRFEAKRILMLTEVRKKIFTLGFIAGPLLLIALVSALSFEASRHLLTEPFVYIVLFALLMFILWLITKPIKAFKSDIKSRIFPKIFAYFGEDFHYSETSRYNDPMAKLEPSKIVPSYDRESCEDFIKGSYKDVRLELFEAHLEDERRSNNSNHYTTVFRGLVVHLSMNKAFRGQTIIKRDIGKIGGFFRSKVSQLSQVKLEDPKFEKLFDVFSNDQIEARYLLTPSFMERLIQLDASIGRENKIQASFYHGNLLLMIPTKKNLFETASVYEPIDFKQDAKIILDEMNIIFSIIDTLKLYERSGL